MPTADAPALSLVPSDEEVLLRETVAAICSDFGPAYMRKCHADGEPPAELWDALASRGFLGVNLPEKYGGGGLGMQALVGGGGGDRARGLLAAADRGVAGDRGVDPRAARDRGSEGRLAAGDRGGHDARRVRDHRARRGLELAQHLDGRAPRGRRLVGAARDQDLHLARWRTLRRCWWWRGAAP